MRLTLEDLEERKLKANRARAKANAIGVTKKGLKPRAKAETIALSRATLKKIRNAIKSGILDLSGYKTNRRIVYNGLK